MTTCKFSVAMGQRVHTNLSEVWACTCIPKPTEAEPPVQIAGPSQAHRDKHSLRPASYQAAPNKTPKNTLPYD